MNFFQVTTGALPVFDVPFLNWSWFSSPSKVPQFIYDLNHPWIEKNKRWLERRETPLYDLCDLDSPLRKEGIEGRICPPDLFQRLEIDNNRAGINRPGWENAMNILEELKDCPAALQTVNHLHVDIYISGGRHRAAEPDDPGYEILQLFFNVLAAMPNLESLKWGLPAHSAPYFEQVFVQQNLRLPSVSHLVPGAFSHYLVPMCPNLKRIEAGDYYDHWSWKDYPSRHETDPTQLLLYATSLVATITDLSFSFQGSWREGWDSENVKKVFQVMPNLVNLTLKGDLQASSRRTMGWRERWEEGSQLKAILTELKSFTQLCQLNLPDAAGLDYQFDGGAWCGNAYMGPGGREYGREVSKSSAEVTEVAGDMTMSILPHLKSFSIGRYSPNITWSDNGTTTLSWPWTGRMQEWLYEVWPEPKKGTIEYDY